MSKRWVTWLGVFGLAAIIGGTGLCWSFHASRGPSEAELVASGRLRDAQLLLRNAIAKAPNAPEPHVRMGELQLKLADPIAAEKEFRRALELGVPTDIILGGLARSLLLQRRFGEVLRLVPATGATPAAAARNLLLRAEAQLAQEDMRGAERNLALSRAAAPEKADTALIAAKVAATKPSSAETEPLTDEVLKRDPANLDALLLKVRLAAERGDRAASGSAIEHALDKAPWSIAARLDRAYHAMERDNDGQARSDVTILLRDQPTLVDAVYLNAVLLFRQGSYAEASTQLARLDAASSRFPQVVFFQARIAQVQKQLETAAEPARRYNALVPADPDGVRLRAETELALGRTEDALSVIRQVAQARPDDLATQTLYGRLLTATRDGAEASCVLLRVCPHFERRRTEQCNAG